MSSVLNPAVLFVTSSIYLIIISTQSIVHLKTLDLNEILKALKSPLKVFEFLSARGRCGE